MDGSFHSKSSPFFWDNPKKDGLEWKIPIKMDDLGVPSGKHTKKQWKDPPFYSWVNPLFLWPCSIAMFVYQRVLVVFWLVVDLPP